MDLCTFFGIWDTDRAIANCRHPSIFGTSVIFALQYFVMSSTFDWCLHEDARRIAAHFFNCIFSSFKTILHCITYIYIYYTWISDLNMEFKEWKYFSVFF